MSYHNDLTARRAASRLRLIYARLFAFAVLGGAMLVADGLADGALDQPWLWGGWAAVLTAYHTLTVLGARLLLGWQRRAIRRMVGQPDKRAVSTLRAVQVIDLAPAADSPWWMEDSGRTAPSARSAPGAAG